jgi:tetratricopeptide (TPR) repeat protein
MEGGHILRTCRWLGRRFLAPLHRRFWKRLTLQLKAVRLLATELILFAVVVGGAVLILREINTPSVRISVSTVPEDLRLSGFTEAVATELIRAELESIQVKAETSMTRAATWREDQTMQFSIPGTGLGFGDVIQQIKRFLDKSDMTITVYMARTNGQLAMTIRSSKEELALARGWISGASESEIVHLAAEQIARASQPFILASYYHSAKETEKCRKLIDEISHAYPANTAIRARAYNLLGLMLEDSGNFSLALQEYEHAVEHDPAADYALVNMGNLQVRQKKFDEAKEAYRKALAINADDPSALSGMGNALNGERKLDEAVAAYRQAIEIDSDYQYAYYGLGNALHDQKKFDESTVAYRRVIEIDPKFASAFNGLGNSLYWQGKLDEAMAAYRTGIEIDAKLAFAHSGIGNILREQGKPEEAEAAYREAIKIEPHASAFNGLGNAMTDQHKIEDALAAYRKALELEPDSAMVWANICIAQFEDKRTFDARASCDMAIKLASGDPWVANVYQTYFGAVPSRDETDFSTAAGGQEAP